MNVSELERMAVNMNSEYDRDRVEAWEYFCDIAPYLVRRVIAAENMADAIRENMPALHDHCWDGPQQELEGVLQAYEATK